MKQMMKDIATIGCISISAMWERVATYLTGEDQEHPFNEDEPEPSEPTVEQELDRVIHPDLSTRMN